MKCTLLLSDEWIQYQICLDRHVIYESLRNHGTLGKPSLEPQKCQDIQTCFSVFLIYFHVLRSDYHGREIVFFLQVLNILDVLFLKIKSDPKTFKQQTTQKSKEAQQLYEWQLHKSSRNQSLHNHACQRFSRISEVYVVVFSLFQMRKFQNNRCRKTDVAPLNVHLQKQNTQLRNQYGCFQK